VPSGAVERKLGAFELGGSGTIVLDEVAALSTGAQGKLLRVLQERNFERLGGTETLRIEARLIALPMWICLPRQGRQLPRGSFFSP